MNYLAVGVESLALIEFRDGAFQLFHILRGGFERELMATFAALPEALSCALRSHDVVRYGDDCYRWTAHGDYVAIEKIEWRAA